MIETLIKMLRRNSSTQTLKKEETTMSKTKMTQKQKILHYYKGAGKTVTAKELVSRYKILSPYARIFELREQNYDVRSLVFKPKMTQRGRWPVKYQVMRTKLSNVA